eukprot:TRINITY_DN13660_c0_g1_i1.p1 TRINITY_DN13660_c0_g1~~TRINITY_DN13660_c0_g1_i1.p1  ORF type:complete len:106 (-),score=1.58 TRINITY_DN13660_c0_g1_i1:373-690(-)
MSKYYIQRTQFYQSREACSVIQGWIAGWSLRHDLWWKQELGRRLGVAVLQALAHGHAARASTRKLEKQTRIDAVSRVQALCRAHWLRKHRVPAQSVELELVELSD